MSFLKKLVLVVLVVLAAAGVLGACSPGETAVWSATAEVGVRYRSGGASPAAGFDCSGLTSWAWGQAGTHLPHSAAAQYAATRRIGQSQLRPGDLVFYGFGGRVSHVAMYAGNGRIVHAQKAGIPVAYQPMSWWASNRIGFGRVAA